MSDHEFQLEAYSEPLDPFSTSASVALVLRTNLRCEYGAPFFAFNREGKRYGVVQGCCNHWDCIRCGEQVAKQHYGRIVEGARKISSEHQLYFVTVTCRGLELSPDEAMRNYGEWIHRLLRTCQQKHTRHGGFWTYVQVTEKQKRGHPHSHILTTFSPHDMVEGAKPSYSTGGDGRANVEWTDAIRSEWLQETVCKAGLGDQYDISVVKDFEAASRYVAKYMFKPSQFTDNYPKGWKRVRYAQNWPKLPTVKTDAFVLLSPDDWRHLATLASVVDAGHGEAFEAASFYLRREDTILFESGSKKESDYAGTLGL